MFRWALWKGRAATLVSRATDLVATTTMLLGVGLLAPAAAHASVQSVVSPYTMTPERMLASLAAVVALIGVVIGGLALTRSAGRVGTGNGRRGAIVALRAPSTRPVIASSSSSSRPSRRLIPERRTLAASSARTTPRHLWRR